MFSSKSTKLLEYYYKYRLKYKCLLISYAKDIRYDKEAVVTHNKFSEKSTPILLLMNIFTMDEYKNSDVILIDEGQFFPDIVDFAKRAVNIDNKIIIICGLNGDYEKKPIGRINELISEADEIEFQKAICHYCQTPENAIFSLRINRRNKEQIIIGEKDLYVPVCRYHFNQKMNINNKN